MASCLEKVPRDILHHIVLLTTTSSPFDSPAAIFNLLQTNTNIHHTLSYKTCSHLYSSIFKAKFDLAAPTRRYAGHDGLKQDLWTALWMILESDGINEAQLAAARFPSFILTLLRSRAVQEKSLEQDDPDYEVLSLTIWLLWLTYSRRDIEGLPLHERQEILQVLRPFALSKTKSNLYHYPRTTLHTAASTVSRYERNSDVPCLDPTIPAITLTFALNELYPMVAPSHFPATRAVALIAQRTGPTLEDFQILESYKTSLFANSCLPFPSNSVIPPVDAKRSLRHDFEFSSLFSSDSYFTPGAFYIPGRLTGIWQGTYLIAPMPSTENSKVSPIENPDFACRQPMQCALSEYLCFSPNLPVPTDGSWDTMEPSPGRLLELEANFQDGLEICSRKYGYEKYIPASKVSSRICRNPSQALDVIIAGETLDDHDQAWGGFKFTGRVRRDGLIILKREPKNANETHLGTWFIEGRLNFEKNFVGRWRFFNPSLESPNSHGIFSMAKRACN
ncbi:hypothetical protein BDQ17DRAFT_1246075 [Cyathus striatus]|nr:hypothetical protein BDQ17DRAFT_1246075 [Cyathus striatus]